MSHMQMFIYDKGALYSADCARCGCTMFAHEWADADFNERRDALRGGTLRCDSCCDGAADPQTFVRVGRQYAGRYSAPGYMDCTDWHYSANMRALRRELRDAYAE